MKNSDKLNMMKLPKRNWIFIDRHEKPKHRYLKFLVCNALLDVGIRYYTECYLSNGKRGDIVCPEANWVFEIKVSESDESIEQKRKTYLGFKIYVIEKAEDLIDIFGKIPTFE